MNFNFFKKHKTAVSEQEKNLPAVKDDIFDANIKIYGSIQPYEDEDFSPFDEDYFSGENYEKKKRRRISQPKTPPSFFIGFLIASGTVATVCASVVFFTFFHRFSGLYTQIEIPNLISLPEADAIKLLENSDCFNYSIEYQENPSAPQGSIISQYPNPKTQRRLLSKNDKITVKLTVNKKNEPLTLPSILGQEARNVALELRNAGINVKIKEAFSDTVKAGKIIASSHKKGSKIARGSTVTITKSLGKSVKYVTVPDVLGISESEAVSILTEKNFEISNVSYESSPYPTGLVIEQSLNSGESVRERSKIDLTVSLGKSNS